MEQKENKDDSYNIIFIWFEIWTIISTLIKVRTQWYKEGFSNVTKKKKERNEHSERNQ